MTQNKGTADSRLMGKSGESKQDKFYRRMYFIRRFEEKLLQLFEEGILNGTTHACIGQEADCVAIFENLKHEDHVFSNHRCHGHYLAQTGDALGLIAEIMGKKEGICGGIGGSQHICAPGFKSNGIQGGIVPTAAGIALAKQLRGENGISVVFLGDGTFGEGVIYETFNISSLWKLPILFVVENNLWSQSTPIRLNFAGNMSDRFAAFGIPVREIVSTDVLEIDQVAREEIDVLRDEQSPRALIIQTYRLCHHSKNDDSRPADEIEEHRKKEPLKLLGPKLSSRDAIEKEVEDALDEVIETARQL